MTKQTKEYWSKLALIELIQILKKAGNQSGCLQAYELTLKEYSDVDLEKGPHGK